MKQHHFKGLQKQFKGPCKGPSKTSPLKGFSNAFEMPLRDLYKPWNSDPSKDAVTNCATIMATSAALTIYFNKETPSYAGKLQQAHRKLLQFLGSLGLSESDLDKSLSTQVLRWKATADSPADKVSDKGKDRKDKKEKEKDNKKKKQGKAPDMNDEDDDEPDDDFQIDETTPAKKRRRTSKGSS